jgi:hypothetical protein
MVSVVLTNYATPQLRERCINLGANRVFDKSDEFEPFLQYCVRLANEKSTLMRRFPTSKSAQD